MSKSHKSNFKKLPIPGWLLVVFMAIYCEVMLHLWITESVDPGRLAIVIGFALGCGSLLGLISILTAGSAECRAWTIKRGTKAPHAPGKIHTDFERGFIRAEVIAFEDMKACGTMAAAKAKGLVRSEGKEYVMKDGDIVNFLFNV